MQKHALNGMAHRVIRRRRRSRAAYPVVTTRRTGNEWAERDDATEAAGLTFGGAVVMVSPEELQRLRNQEKNS